MKDRIRLDKYLADMGKGSRGTVKDSIRTGFVRVNDTVETDPGRRIDIRYDRVSIHGETVDYFSYEYWMLYKPEGVLSATSDRKQRTALDLLKDAKRRDLSVAGRLDQDTQGLLFLTNDGALIHRLLTPKHHVTKLYYARLHGCIQPADIQAFADGLIVDDELTALPALLYILSVSQEDAESEVLIGIQEGKFHQVKRMFAARSLEVTFLKRLSIGPLHLDERLRPGESRKLTQRELSLLQTAGSAIGVGRIKEGDGKQLPLLDGISAVIFDLDGTLIDSMWVWEDIDREYLQRFERQAPQDLAEAIAGISVTQTAVYFKEHFGIDDSIEKIIEDWNDMAGDKYRNEIFIKPGARELLKYLHCCGVPCAIATSNSRSLAEQVLKSNKIEHYFSTIITGEDIPNGKPQPDIYLEAARRLGVQPQDCLVFEDIPHGLLAAVRAGMHTAAVWDAHAADVQEEVRVLADYVMRDFLDVFDLSYENLRGGRE